MDKAQQLSNLNAQKPNSLAGVRAWTTVYFPITLADYLDFGQRLALCTSSILTRRRLQQADGGAPAGPPLPGEVPAIAAAGALAANGTGTEPPAVPLAAALEAAAPANISALPLDNPLFAALASAGGLPQNTPEAAAAAATPAARPDALALSGLPGALLAAPAAPKVLNPIVIAAACQQLVDWVGVKADFILAKLLPMAVGEIKPLLDFMVSAISWFNDIASAVDTLTSPTHWNAYLGACGSYLTKAFGDGRCDNACLTLLTPSAQTISAIGKAAMGMHASADKLLAGSRTLADWASYVRASFCKTTRIAKGTEFRKLSIWEALESAIKGRRLAVQVTGLIRRERARACSRFGWRVPHGGGGVVAFGGSTSAARCSCSCMYKSRARCHVRMQFTPSSASLACPSARSPAEYTAAPACPNRLNPTRPPTLMVHAAPDAQGAR